MPIPPKLRQLAVAASTQFAAFSVGGATTYPTLLLEQFQAGEASQLNINTRSWIGSIHGLVGTAAILMPIIAQKTGRKFGFMISCLILMIGWILAYTAKTATQIITSESFLGLGSNSLIIISYMCLSEMLAPKYRHVSMQLYSVIFHLGITVGGILGRYLNFTTVGLIMLSSILCASLVSTAIWPESPYWLACRGKFEKCTDNFVKLRGEDEDSMKELKELIAAQTENLNHVKVRKKINLHRLWTKISSRDFYVSTLHVLLLFVLYFWSGSSVILIYFIDIVKKTIHNENVTHYAGIAFYAISFTGSIVTTFLVAKFKNKTVILSNAFGAIVCLICSFVVTGLQSLEILSKDSYLLIYCMLGFTACSGVSAVYFVASEIIPVRHRNIGGALYTIYTCSLSTLTLKLSPYMFLYIGFSGTFLFFTLIASLCILLIWKYVPETKGRSLQELEDFYTFGRFIQRNDENAEIQINRGY